MFDAEHFFDGYKANPDYALRLPARRRYDAGARWIVLCDTNGGTLPHEVERIVGEVARTIPGDQPRHPLPQRHRERGRQLAGRGARRRAPGAGHAERPGRALRQRQPRLADPEPDAEDGLRRPASRDEELAPAHPCLAPAGRAAEPRAQPRTPPYVGESAFAHKGGLHVSAVEKDPRTYEHVEPEQGRQPPPHRRLRPGRPRQHPRALPRDRARGRRRTTPRLARLVERREGARVRRLRL